MNRLLVALLLLAAPAAAVEVTVWHTNDVHGWLMARPAKDDPKKLVGGAPAFAALLARHEGPRLLLDAGDWWQGTPEGSLTHGAVMAEYFNALGYDAVVVGNHEYDAGADKLKALIPRIAAPVLSANTRDAKSGKRVEWVRPWVVKEVAGVKFGIFGLTTTGMKRLSFPKNIAGLSFRREADEARDAVAELKKAGAEVIIALTHVGFEQDRGPKYEGDQTIAREVPGIDLIVGGHSHTFLREAWREPKNGTLVTQAGQYLFAAGKTTLVIDDKTRKVVSSSDELIDLDPAKGEDEKVKALVSARSAEVDRVFSVVLATAAAAFNRESDRESALGAWMTDCYRSRFSGDLALQNGGGIRADLPAGPVTLRSLFNVMPFDNYVVKLTMKGADVRQVLDHGVGQARMAQFSGAAVTARRKAPAGERLSSAFVGGKPLDDAKEYALVTLDFIVNGGDGFSVFDRAVRREETEVLARDALRACAESQKTLALPTMGRITLSED
ncbi:MAG: bifunctional UDP-sugar hydrolase/5'-nucleotidase [Elusimicrobiota bacterium]|nr:bifunctional UDP-sugar hydrolase/5'-nucleotidase [Elusimicrobiota bacterium]